MTALQLALWLAAHAAGMLPEMAAGHPPGQSARASLLAAPVQADESPEDRWFASDKYRHFFIAYGATAFAFGTLHLAGLDRDERLAAAAATGIVASIGKEIADVRAGSHFCFRDLIYDLLGAGVAVFVVGQAR